MLRSNPKQIRVFKNWEAIIGTSESEATWALSILHPTLVSFLAYVAYTSFGRQIVFRVETSSVNDCDCIIWD